MNINLTTAQARVVLAALEDYLESIKRRGEVYAMTAYPSPAIQEQYKFWAEESQAVIDMLMKEIP